LTGVGAALASAPRPGRRRGLFWPVLAALPVLALLLGLGTWQVQRLAWKTDLLDRIAASEAGPPVALGTGVPPPYTKLAATGRFDHARESLLALEVRGTTLGAHLLTPLLRDEAPPVLVDRGWVPLERSAPIARPEGEQRVVGWARAPETRGSMAARDDLAGRRFYTFDPLTIGAAIGVPEVLPFALVALGPAGRSPPIPAQHVPRPNNPHLGYAITWFGLAAALVGVVAVFTWRRRKDPA
jgi:surfeit locus 1 family protein